MAVGAIGRALGTEERDSTSKENWVGQQANWVKAMRTFTMEGYMWTKMQAVTWSPHPDKDERTASLGRAKKIRQSMEGPAMVFLTAIRQGPLGRVLAAGRSQNQGSR